MFALPDLPYPYDALAPVISERTLRFHHDKHHATYVKTVNELVAKSGVGADSLESLIAQSATAEDRKLFNNAAQAWNHGYFWECMSDVRTAPSGELENTIQRVFGGLDKLRETFVGAGSAHFGSGWVWLAVERGGALKVLSTHDAADTLTIANLTPLLVCDLWEHAYYLDHQNDRKSFLEGWFDNLANWDFADSQLAASQAGGRPWRYPAPVAAAVAA